MYLAGEEEIEAIAKVIRSGKLFRYRDDSECERFEKRYAKHLGVSEFALGASGTYGLAAGLVGLGIGPGDEVLVPAHTYMATATAVLAVGAIPVIVDIDESITISPGRHPRRDRSAYRARSSRCTCGARPATWTRSWTSPIAGSCSCWRTSARASAAPTRAASSARSGDAGAFSFNFFKNMSGGEGGGIATSDPEGGRAGALLHRSRAISTGRAGTTRRSPSPASARAPPSCSARHAQRAARPAGRHDPHHARREEAHPRRARNISAISAYCATPMNSADHDCATQVMFTLPSEEAATTFVKTMPAVIAGKTGRHTFTQSGPGADARGAHHPAINLTRCRRTRGCVPNTRKACARTSLEILNRTVMVATSPAAHRRGDRGDHPQHRPGRARARWRMWRWTMWC